MECTRCGGGVAVPPCTTMTQDGLELSQPPSPSLGEYSRRIPFMTPPDEAPGTRTRKNDPTRIGGEKAAASKTRSVNSLETAEIIERVNREPGS
ncbi:hypothetical protein AAE478_008804 [Parahypoxylon ruwenzoriense]